jgi:hypothetical protein
MSPQFYSSVFASIGHGLLTELPAQLVTAAVVAAAASLRARDRRAKRAKDRDK